MLKVNDNQAVELSTYDTFGLITVASRRVTASASCGPGNKSVTRSVARDLAYALPGVSQDEQIAATFGTMLSEGRNLKISIHMIGTLKSGMEIQEIREVNEVVTETLTLLRQALFE